MIRTALVTPILIAGGAALGVALFGCDEPAEPLRAHAVLITAHGPERPDAGMEPPELPDAGSPTIAADRAGVDPHTVVVAALRHQHRVDRPRSGRDHPVQRDMSRTVESARRVLERAIACDTYEARRQRALETQSWLLRPQLWNFSDDPCGMDEG